MPSLLMEAASASAYVRLGGSLAPCYPNPILTSMVPLDLQSPNDNPFEQTRVPSSLIRDLSLTPGELCENRPDPSQHALLLSLLHI